MSEKGVRWCVNPPKYVQKAIGAYHQTFSDPSEAVAVATDIANKYDAYKNGLEGVGQITDGSVLGLIAAYKRTNSWQKLSDNSKITYNQLLRDVVHFRTGKFKTPFKDMLTVNVSVQHAEEIYAGLCDSISIHRANHVCKLLRRLWFVGVRLGLTKTNPFQKMGLPKLEDRKVLWQQHEVMAFIEQADNMGLHSIGTLAMICYDICQRGGDVRQMKWSNYKNGWFTFTQEKTKVYMEILASPRLQERLKNTPKSSEDDHIIIYEATNKPYDRRLYAKVAARVRNAAGLPEHLQIRDLRRTGATEMAESGCTEDELRSVTGHQSRDVLSTYVRPTKRLAEAGIQKRFA